MSGLELKHAIEWFCIRGIIVRCGLDNSLSESFALTESTLAMQKFAKQVFIMINFYVLKFFNKLIKISFIL